MQPAELHSDSGLEVVGAFSHRDLVPFLLEELSRRTKVLRVYWALGYGYALALVGCMAYALSLIPLLPCRRPTQGSTRVTPHH